jgi:hypothetical protein
MLGYFEVIGWNFLYREILDISMGFNLIAISAHIMDRLCCFSCCLVYGAVCRHHSLSLE